MTKSYHGTFQSKSVLKQRGRQVEEGYLQCKFSEWASASTINHQQSATTNVRDLLSELKSYTRKRDLHKGRGAHKNAVNFGIDSNIYVANALINLYGKCGSMQDARTVFNSIQEPNVVSWNSLILGYADNKQGLVALNLFSRMKEEGKCAPKSLTYIAALKACTSLAEDGSEVGKRECLERGRQIHFDIGCHIDHLLQSTLINLYAKCGNMEDARIVFDSIKNPDVVSWTALILGYADNGQGFIALDLFSRMKIEGCTPNSFTYVAVLKACTLLAADGGEAGLEIGRKVHSDVGCHMDHFIQNTLINMYSKYGRMEEARTVFDSIQEPNVVSWNCLIQGYADNGLGLVALDLLSTMKEECRCAPDSSTYVAAFKACALLAADGSEAGKQKCLEMGKKIHFNIACHIDHFAQNTLINMYAKCGSMKAARRLFNSLKDPEVVSWNCLILGYADNGQGLFALDLFSRMKTEGRCAPDSSTFVACLKACTSLAADGSEAGKQKCLERGRQIHSDVGEHMNHFVQHTLINMYSKCGSMQEARTVFDSIHEPNVISWNCLILGYADNGQGLVALDLFARMKDECRCAPTSFTYVAALMACSSIGALGTGRKIHSVIREFECHVVTCLVDFYAKCGSMEEAREVFDLHPLERDVSTWTALLAGYSQFGDTGSVFSLFDAMQDQGFQPNSVTFLCMLSCCSHAGLIGKAWEYLEAMPVRYGVTPTVIHYSCMIDLLGRANKLDEAVALLQKMPCDPNAVTWTALLGACRKWKNAEIGRWAFKSLVDLEQNKSPAYVLMAEIYGSRGMWEEQERVLEAWKNLYHG